MNIFTKKQPIVTNQLFVDHDVKTTRVMPDYLKAAAMVDLDKPGGKSEEVKRIPAPSSTTVGGFSEAMRKTLSNYVFNIAKLEEDAARVKEQLRQLYLSAVTASTALDAVINDPALTESEVYNAKQALADYGMQVIQSTDSVDG